MPLVALVSDSNGQHKQICFLVAEKFIGLSCLQVMDTANRFQAP